jgi:hypothetical protein
MAGGFGFKLIVTFTVLLLQNFLTLSQSCDIELQRQRCKNSQLQE